MITNALAGLAVDDLPLSIEWYARVIDRSPDTRPMPNVAEWKLPAGGCVQVFADAERAGRASVTLVVDDLERESGRLARRGIDVPEPTTTSIVRTAILVDPAGNQVVLAQPLSAAVSS